MLVFNVLVHDYCVSHFIFQSFFFFLPQVHCCTLKKIDAINEKPHAANGWLNLKFYDDAVLLNVSVLSFINPQLCVTQYILLLSSKSWNVMISSAGDPREFCGLSISPVKHFSSF